MAFGVTPAPVSKSRKPARSGLVEAGLFLAVGGTATLLNMIFYAGLVNLAGIKPTIAAAVAFLLVVPFHFVSYSRIVFPPDAFDAALFARYICALALSFTLNVGLVWVYWDQLKFEPLPAQVIALIPAILANYLSFKFFVFRFQKIAVPAGDAGTLMDALTALVAAVTLYAAIAAMLSVPGPGPDAAAAAALKREALQAHFSGVSGVSHLIPELIVRLNAILFASAPSILAILAAGLVGLAGLIIAYVTVELSEDWTKVAAIERLAAALTILAAVMVLRVSTLSPQPYSALDHALVLFAATCGALCASGHLGPLRDPWTLAGFVAAATLATLSDPAGRLVWLIAPAGLVMRYLQKPESNYRSLNFIALLTGFACAALVIFASKDFLAVLAALAISGVVMILGKVTWAEPNSRWARTTGLLAIALGLGVLAYRTIAG